MDDKELHASHFFPFVNQICISIIIAGFIVLMIGLYFQFIGAGIPYQDPTAELTVRWNANFMAGSLCLKAGTVTLILGVLGNVVLRILVRRIR